MILCLKARTEALTLVTDGERRYGKIIFEICHELLRNSKVDDLVKSRKCQNRY